MRSIGRFSRVALAALLIPGATLAQDKSAAPAPDYVPSLADMMAVTQLRHFKLWYAARFENWELAMYELTQMTASFKTASRLYPGEQAADMSGMAKPAELIGEAINAKDSVRFETAFSQMTAACNGCHVATGRAFIVIRVPMRSPFSNQTFEPLKR